MGEKFDATALLKSHSLRVTPGRIALLNVLGRYAQPLSVAEIEKKLARTPLDQVTLYRALDVFVSSGIVRRIELQKERSHYELNTDHHHHIVCTSCGTIKDFEACEIDKVSARALQQVKGFAAVNSHSFELFGLCTGCARTTTNQ